MTCSQFSRSQDSLIFSSVDHVWQYADGHSITFQNTYQQNILSKYQTLAAQWNRWNIQGKANLTLTDNTKLVTNFLPAEIFGGPAGTFRQVTFGQKYVSNFNLAPQFDILNPYASAQVKMSKANEKLTEVTHLITKKDLYESIAGAYYNILSYQWQRKVTEQSLQNADTIFQIMRHKNDLGIIRQQDVNDAKANVLTLQDKLQQLEVQMQQQVNSLKILCDIPAATPIQIDAQASNENDLTQHIAADGNLTQRQTDLSREYQKQLLNADKKWYYPTVSFFSSFGWQQNTNGNFFDNSRWFSNNYLGLKISIPILPDANKIAAVKYDKINLLIAENNFQHAALQDSINNNQMELDYSKAYNSWKIAQDVEALKGDSYAKNLNIYKEGILSATDLFTSFGEWLNSRLNTVVQKANARYAASKITISHLIK